MKTVFIVLVGALLLVISACAGLAVDRIDLSGEWKFGIDIPDAGLEKAWHMPEFDDSEWLTLQVPGDWESQGITEANPNWDQADDLNQPYTGYAWYRRTVEIPAEWEGRVMILSLGRIDDLDWAYLNGTLIGETTRQDAKWPSAVRRAYSVPADAVRFGEPNVIAVRVLDLRGLGGIVEGPVSISTRQEAPLERVRTDDIVRVGSSALVDDNEEVANAVVVLGDLTVRGHVSGDVVVVLGELRLLPGSRVDGDVVVIGSVRRDDRAQVGGSTVHIGFLGWKRYSWGTLAEWYFGLLVSLVGSIFFALLAALIAALFPNSISTISSTAFRKPGESALFGIAGLLLIIPVMVLLAITCIGIPLIPVQIILVIASWIFGSTAVSLAIGQRVSGALNRPIVSIVLATFAGAIILGLVNIVPIAGSLAVFILSMIGFGAVLSTKFGVKPDWLINRTTGGQSTPPAE